MPDDTQIEKPILQQILDDMFSKLEGNSDFDPQTVQSLKQLADKGDLRNPLRYQRQSKSDRGECMKLIELEIHERAASGICC